MEYHDFKVFIHILWRFLTKFVPFTSDFRCATCKQRQYTWKWVDTPESWGNTTFRTKLVCHMPVRKMSIWRTDHGKLAYGETTSYPKLAYSVSYFQRGESPICPWSITHLFRSQHRKHINTWEINPFINKHNLPSKYPKAISLHPCLCHQIPWAKISKWWLLLINCLLMELILTIQMGHIKNEAAIKRRCWR